MSQVSGDLFKQENCQERNSVCQRTTQPTFSLLTFPSKVPCELLLPKPLHFPELPATCAALVLQQLCCNPAQTETGLRIRLIHNRRANRGAIESSTGFPPAVDSLLFSYWTVSHLRLGTLAAPFNPMSAYDLWFLLTHQESLNFPG